VNSSTTPAPPCTIVIFGAAGDLTKRLLMPAIYNLAGSKLLDDKLAILGADHNDGSAASWRAELAAAMQSFTKTPGAEFHPDAIDEARWDWVARRLDYLVIDFNRPDDFKKLKTQLESAAAGNVIFYLAVAAQFFATIVDNLAAVGLLEERPDAFRRLCVEKPFGTSLTSARALNANILRVARESQVYRVDHFLGKEPVQGIMPLRFSNGLFEPMWNRDAIDSVQITAAETLGVEERGRFYEATGSFDAESVRNEKAKLLEAIRPILPENAARGQYSAGAVGGTPVKAYRDEDDVANDSRTETYAALKVEIDNRRWSGVPFYLRTGKRLATHLTTIAIRLRPAAGRMFPGRSGVTPKANTLTLGIAPKQGVTATFGAKEPGPVLAIGDVKTTLDYKDFFEEPPADGYETLLYHAMTGNTLLFQREDMVDASWTAVQPVLDAWDASHDSLPQYEPGSAGPREADAVLERDGRSWLPLEYRPRRGYVIRRRREFA
jgi:glucose-6-phosphate 1-dehydrogenase